MTAIIGILCDDGVVIGADSSATFGTPTTPTIEQQCEKITIINDKVILAGAGAVGSNQRFAEVIKQGWQNGIFNGSGINVARTLCRNFLDDLQYTHARVLENGALVAFPSNGNFYLTEFPITNFQPEMKDRNLWYSSMGNNMVITDSFLGFMREVFWKNGPPKLNQGIFAVVWTLNHVIQVNVGGVNKPKRVAVLEMVGGELKARMLEQSEIDEHRQNVMDAQKHLNDYLSASRTGAVEEIPTPP